MKKKIYKISAITSVIIGIVSTIIVEVRHWDRNIADYFINYFLEWTIPVLFFVLSFVFYLNYLIANINERNDKNDNKRIQEKTKSNNKYSR